jgi:hypothetical protein
MTILRFLGWAIGIVVITAAAASVWMIVNKPPSPVPPVVVAPVATTTPPHVVAEASYLCDGNRAIKAVFMDTDTPAKPATPDMPPTSTGSVALTLDTAPAITLPQSISADGARYGNESDALVFWSKGSGALVLQNGREGMYTNCIVVKDNAGGLSQTYHDGAMGFTLRYPMEFGVTASYTYNGLGAKKGIPGIKFTIPTSTATGTNLSADSFLSIEHLGTTTATCDASAFLLPKTHGSSTELTEGDMTYSFASSSDAGAGNRYEEMVYAIPGSSPCMAVRTFVHYTAIENYASGTVTAFDRVTLEKTFAAIRNSITFVPHMAPVAPAVPVATTTPATTTSAAAKVATTTTKTATATAPVVPAQ